MKRILTGSIIMMLVLSFATAFASVPTSKELKYFMEVALGSEYGDSSVDYIKKWVTPIRIRVYGNPTDQDLATLDQHIDDLNGIPGIPEIQRVTSNENISLYFVPFYDIKNYITNYVEGSWGFFTCWSSRQHYILRAQIAIATDKTNQRQRNHIILEEITQALGIMRDSYQYSNSIFYQKWTGIQTLSELDWRIVEILYSPEVEAGMTETEIYKAFNLLPVSKEGDADDVVLRMKKRLQELGYFRSGVELSNRYNDTCVERVALFQQVNDVPETGIMDEQTYALLFSDNAKANPN